MTRTSVTTYHDADVKIKVRDPERLTSCNKNIVSAPRRLGSVWQTQRRHRPKYNNDHTLTPLKSGFSKGEMTTMYGDRDNHYGGNKSRQLDSNHDNEVKMTKNAKRIISWTGEGLALTKDVKKSNLQRSYEIV